MTGIELALLGTIYCTVGVAAAATHREASR